MLSGAKKGATVKQRELDRDLPRSRRRLGESIAEVNESSAIPWLLLSFFLKHCECVGATGMSPGARAQGATAGCAG
jgi:hypothetical protein